MPNSNGNYHVPKKAVAAIATILAAILGGPVAYDRVAGGSTASAQGGALEVRVRANELELKGRESAVAKIDDLVIDVAKISTQMAAIADSQIRDHGDVMKAIETLRLMGMKR